MHRCICREREGNEEPNNNKHVVLAASIFPIVLVSAKTRIRFYLFGWNQLILSIIIFFIITEGGFVDMLKKDLP